MSSLTLNPAWELSLGITITFAIVYPIVLTLFATRRFHTSWKYAGFGALIFLIFQIVTRLPIIAVIGAMFGKQLTHPLSHAVIYVLALSLTAALFEEIGRYLGYRWFMGNEEKTWPKAVVYGLGHGGFESITIVGIGSLLTLINLIAYQHISIALLPLQAQHAIINEFKVLNAQPIWFPLLGAWERLWTVFVQVAFSVIIAQVFIRKQIFWLWIAIAAHFLVDASTSLIAIYFGNSVAVAFAEEGLVMIFGVIAMYFIVHR